MKGGFFVNVVFAKMCVNVMNVTSSARGRHQRRRADGRADDAREVVRVGGKGAGGGGGGVHVHSPHLVH